MSRRSGLRLVALEANCHEISEKCLRMDFCKRLDNLAKIGNADVSLDGIADKLINRQNNQ